MLDGVSLHDGDIETTRLMIPQSTVFSSYQYSHQRSSYMKNTLLSIETGNHHQDSMIEMMQVPVIHDHYHFKERQAHFHPNKGYSLACTYQFGGSGRRDTGSASFKIPFM